MSRANLLRATALLALTATLSPLTGCKKGDETAPIPAPSASAPTPVATTDPGDAGAPADAAPPPPPAPTATAPQRAASIDACCGALAAIQKSGKGATTKAAAGRAAAICPGIAARVKSGETSRAAGLGLIRGSLSGVAIPGECR